MKRFWDWLASMFDFDARRRAIDLQILWPICVDEAPDLDHAKAVFAAHAFNDDAWLSLGHDEVYRIIDGLKTTTT